MADKLAMSPLRWVAVAAVLVATAQMYAMHTGYLDYLGFSTFDTHWRRAFNETARVFAPTGRQRDHLRVGNPQLGDFPRLKSLVAMKTESGFQDLAVLAERTLACTRCKPGEDASDGTLSGRCREHCSAAGYCGHTDAFVRGGTNCTTTATSMTTTTTTATFTTNTTE